MQKILASKRMENVHYAVRGPVLDAAKRLASKGEDILYLNIGNPSPFGFHAPDFLLSDISNQLSVTDAYSDSKGLTSAREAIAGYAKQKGIQDADPDHIYTGNGVSELIVSSMQALLNHGDEMLVPMPDYPLWTAAVNLCGAIPVHYRCDESSLWYPDLDDMRRKITPYTRGIVLINPNNPTGAVYPPEILEGIIKLAREFDLIIFSDEIYDRLCMDGVKHTSIASMCDDVLCVTYNGLSKSHMMAGFRIGWIVISGPVGRAVSYEKGIQMLSSMRLCSNVPGQSVIASALADPITPQSMVKPGGRFFEQRNLVCDALNAIDGVSVVKPQAAFYCFPKLDAKFNITDDEKFAMDFLHSEKVLIVNGTGFSWDKPDHFRVVYLPENDVLCVAMQKLSRFLSDYKQH